jgi:hypothetical protein
MSKKSNKTINIKDMELEFNIEEMNNLENYITHILVEDNFNKLNHLQNQNHNTRKNARQKNNFKLVENNDGIAFISVDINSLEPYTNTISESEFFNIVGANSKGLSAHSGKYQESLYSFYLEAKSLADEGYISDVLNKAMVFQNNLEYVEALARDKNFMKAWHQNCGKESPIRAFKDSGNLRRINMVKAQV